MTLQEHKPFIEQVAKGNINPQLNNDTVVEILNLYKGIDSTVEVLADCATCDKIYKDSFSIILAYLNQDKPKSKK